RLKRLLAGFGAHTVQDLGAGGLERLRDEPGDALAVGHAKDEDGLAGKLQEVVHVGELAPGTFHATEKSTVSTRLSPLLMLPFIIVKPPRTSFRFTSMVIVSPGNTGLRKR